MAITSWELWQAFYEELHCVTSWSRYRFKILDHMATLSQHIELAWRIFECEIVLLRVRGITLSRCRVVRILRWSVCAWYCQMGSGTKRQHVPDDNAAAALWYGRYSFIQHRWHVCLNKFYQDKCAQLFHHRQSDL